MTSPPGQPQPEPRAVPLLDRLLRMALAGILPLATIAGIGLVIIVHDQHKDTERTTLDVARLSGAAIDLQVDRSISLLRMLASSTLIDEGDLPGYERLLQQALVKVPEWHSLILARLDGIPLVYTDAAGSLPHPLVERESFERALTDESPVVGYIAKGPGGTWALPIRMPVVRGGEVRFVLTAVLSPDALLEVIRAQRLPQGWIASIFDAHGKRIARSQAHDTMIGQPPSPSLARLMMPGSTEGFGVTWSAENTKVYTAWRRLPESGWTVAIGIPTADVDRDAVRAFAIYGGGLGTSLLIAIGAALYAARRINRPMRELRAAAAAIGRGEIPRAPRTDILEVREVGRALVESAAAQRRVENERNATLHDLWRAQDDLLEQVADLEQLHQLGNELLQLPTLDRQLEAILRTLCQMHGATVGLVLLAAPGQPLTVRAACGVSGWTVRALEGDRAVAGPSLDVVAEHRRVVVEDLRADARAAGIADFAVAEKVRALHGTPITDAAGEAVGAISVYLADQRAPTGREVRLADLCARLATVFVERDRAATEAGESEQRLRVAVDSSSMSFLVLSPVRDEAGDIADFAFDYVNRAAAQTLTRPVSGLIGQRLGALVPGVWEIPGLFGTARDVAERGVAREAELPFVHAGRHGWFQLVVSPFQDRLALWFADISERKQQEEMLREADRRKDEFLATLAHELRNPLAPIRQAAMITGTAGATEPQKRWSQEVIERQVRHMALLLDDLLDVSRITRGKLELRRTRIELRTAVEAALETTRPLIEARRHRLSVSLPDDPVFLDADPLRFAQILSNLLGNAAKYMDGGGEVRLSARVVEGQAVIDVEDTGIGLAPGEQESIFQMFSQAQSGRERSTGGLGIGLALARGLAQLHGGTVTAESAGVGKGSRFRVVVPVAPTGQRSEAPAKASAAAASRSLRVLVADDNRDSAESLACLLRLAGHEVLVCYDGREALELCLSRVPDVALLDVGMPNLTGHEVAMELRRSPTGKRITLIAITGWGQGRDKVEALRSGFDHHMTKPADPDVLFGLLAATAAASDAE